eukprot:2211064-Rhodomonas_salina.1
MALGLKSVCIASFSASPSAAPFRAVSSPRCVSLRAEASLPEEAEGALACDAWRRRRYLSWSCSCCVCSAAFIPARPVQPPSVPAPQHPPRSTVPDSMPGS